MNIADTKRKERVEILDAILQDKGLKDQPFEAKARMFYLETKYTHIDTLSVQFRDESGMHNSEFDLEADNTDEGLHLLMVELDGFVKAMKFFKVNEN